MGTKYNFTISGTINAPAVAALELTETDISGVINATAATQVRIASWSGNSSTFNVPNATSVSIENSPFNGNIINDKVTSITLGQVDFNYNGKLSCSKLTDIYIPDKTALPTFSGTYAQHFTRPANTITVHVYGMTANEIAAMKNSAVWSGFKEIVNHKTELSYTLVNNGRATISFFGLEGNASYVSATGYTQYAQVYSGSKTGTVKVGGNYAVEIKDVDFTTKDVTLKRNGHLVSLSTGENQGRPVRFYEDLDLQGDVSYEVTVTDKTCNLTLTQTGYRGNITYTKTTNGTTSSGVIYTSPATITCSQGSTLSLSIPYDQYTPQTLTVNGTNYTLTKANGLATATINVPAATSTAGTLTWQEPQQTYETHQPQIMIMRSGEGNVLFKGLCLPEEQAAEAYEQQFGYPADEYGIVVSAVANCQSTVTTVTVPDYDILGRGTGYEFGSDEWGMRTEITPVAGQTLKTLLVGWLSEDEDGRQVIEWEDMLYGEDYGCYVHPEYRYVTFDESTNTYTFNWGFDEMNVWIGDYIINIAMGPEESAVEAGKTLNFVRKGGRGHAWIYWHDNYDFYFDEDGSSSKVIPNEQLTDIQMTVQLNDGETFHVYKDGVDITGQFQGHEGSDEHWAELEKESATYTLLIEESPDANPTWTMMHDGDSIFVDVEYADGTHHEDSFSGLVDKRIFYEPNVSKATLKVYAENLNDSKPRRILKNGVDVTYQFSTMDGVSGKDGFLLFYEVDGSALIDATWEIGYDISHRQTFIVRGGTTEQVVEMEFEHLYGGPTLHANNDGVPVSADLPPYDSEYNSYIMLTLYVKNEETLTVLRNGVDVTSAFTKGDGYYEINASDGNYPNLNTLEALGFQINDPAVWEITVKSLSEQVKTTTIANPDGMEIVYARYYTDGSHLEESITEEYHSYYFDDSDRANTRFILFMVPMDENRPVRVLRDGVDVTYTGSDEWIAGDYVSYVGTLTDNSTWDITYDNSHKQTFLLKGGLYPEVDYEYRASDIVQGLQVNGITEVYLPDHNSDWDNTYADFTIGVKPNETFKALRNGVDVTDKFTKEGVNENLWRYSLNFDDADIAAALGIDDLREAAVWEITIGDDENTGRTMFVTTTGKAYTDLVVNGTRKVSFNTGTKTYQLADGDTFEVWPFTGTVGYGDAIKQVLLNGTDVTNDETYLKEKVAAENPQNDYWRYDFSEVSGSAVIQIIYENAQYDTNKDGRVTIADVTKLVNKILGKE